ncbi:MAG TPA: inorganic diphosphatase [Candidatus Angelobacter sp.]|nr:inorganic diphosphatase [Candidatus Angelobacter sp.]
MVDFDKTLTPGDIEDGIVNVVVEIPAGSIDKVEWHREKTDFELDRVEPLKFTEPSNYGFIPHTLNEDGNELDALIISEESMPTGAISKAKIIGIMKFDDEGETDDKIIVVPVDDINNGSAIKILSDIPKQKIDQITNYFTHYKDMIKPNSTIVKGWGDISEAKDIIYKSIELWEKQ